MKINKNKQEQINIKNGIKQEKYANAASQRTFIMWAIIGLVLGSMFSLKITGFVGFIIFLITFIGCLIIGGFESNKTYHKR